MEHREIIESIDEIYDRYKVPMCLREHMKRVAYVADVICQYWKGRALNRDLIVATCLVHDLGNLVKMDFSNPLSVFMLGEEAVKKDEFIALQKEMIKKYGAKEEDATLNLLMEIGVDTRMFFIVQHMTIRRIHEVLELGDNELMICKYSDLRVSPESIVSLEGRFREAKERYQGRPGFQDVHNEKWLVAAKEIEKKLFKHMNIKPEEIT
ncbi:HD domain-containing protein [Nanoarchaeota archaeon]